METTNWSTVKPVGQGIFLLIKVTIYKTGFTVSNDVSLLTSATISLTGDYSYAELDAIRAKKAEERARRLQGKQTQPPTATPTNGGLQLPSLGGLSSGGIMETRIGAVGGGLPSVPEASAHMY